MFYMEKLEQGQLIEFISPVASFFFSPIPTPEVLYKYNNFKVNGSTLMKLQSAFVISKTKGHAEYFEISAYLKISDLQD